MRFFFIYSISAFFAVIAGQAHAQSVWSYAADDAAQIGSANAIDANSLQVSLRCHVGSGSNARHVARVAEPGVMTLMLAPSLAFGGDQSLTTILVDDVAYLTVQFDTAIPEGVPVVQVNSNSPLLTAIAGGEQLEFSTATGAAQIALRGSSLAIKSLQTYCAASGGRGPTPGFNCTRAGTPTERALCSSPRLARLDTDLNRAMASALQVADPEALRSAQRNWIAQRDRCLADAACLETQMVQRIAALDAGTGALAAASGPEAQEFTPVTVPSFEPPGVVAASTGDEQIVSLEALQTAITLWLVGQRPDFGTGIISANVRPWLNIDLPVGYPQMSSVDTINRSDVDAFVASFVERAVLQPAPNRVTLELPVSLVEQPDGTLSVNAPFVFNHGLQQTNPTALRLMKVPLPLIRNRIIEVTGTQPFLLDPFPRPSYWVRNGEETVIRISMRLSEPEVRMPQGHRETRIPADLAAFGMTIDNAVLLYGGREVHRWDREVAPRGQASFDMTDPVDLAKLFGGRAEQDRLLVTVPIEEERTGIPTTNGYLSVAGNSDSPRQAAAFALALGTLIAETPERRLSADLIRQGANLLLTPIERDAVLPLKFQMGQMNEIEEAKVIDGAEASIRAIVTARMPQTPIKVGAIGTARVGNYDSVNDGFPILGLNLNQLSWLPFARTSAGMRALIEKPIDFLQMPTDQASGLLDRIEVNGRTIYVQHDFEIDVRAVSTGRQGPIDISELATVKIERSSQRMAFFADQQRLEPIQVIQMQAPDDARPFQALPEEVYLTTGATLISAASELPEGTGRLEEAMLRRPDVMQAPESQRQAVIERAAAQIRGRTPDRFWVGALLAVDPYNPDLGGFPIMRFEFVPVAHEFDLDGIEPMNLRPEDPANYALLPVPPEQEKLVTEFIQEGNLQVFFEIDLVGNFDFQQLTVSGPTSALIGPPNIFGGVTEVSLQLEYPKAPSLAGRDGMVVVAPDHLMLTPEAVDLLVLRDEQNTVDQAWLDRMIRERLMIERAAKALNRPPVWGSFFRDPTAEIGETIEPGLRTAFEDWSRRRALTLPDRIVVPLTADGRVHPESGCVGLQELNADWEGIALAESYATIFGAEADALKADFGSFNSSATPLPGPDRVFALRGRSSLAQQGTLCPELPNPQSGSADQAAPYADLVVVIRTLPVFGALPGRFAIADVFLSEINFRSVRLSPASKDAAGLRAAIVVEGTASHLDIWTAPNFRSPAEKTVTLRQDDWQAATGERPSATDIVGLTLGMSQSEFLEAASARLPDALRFDAQARPLRQYGNAVALLDPATRETIVAITAAGEADGQALAIGRQLRFDPGMVTKDALRLSLEEKYGPITEEGEYAGLVLVWGTPNQALDPGDICGGIGKFTRGTRPEFTVADPSRLPVGTSLGGPSFWDLFGWPNPERNEAARVGLENCGPVVTATIRDGAEGTLLTLWLIDEAAARAADAGRTNAPIDTIKLDL